ncbi:DUF4347 domain-containing protein, partial [Scytonema sp. UIC 10036]|uniref:DUF4347 domain-containing protein n=1 Tax=Scytonema sp. UIC 10036 TaxID=2304196 RepID=UPI0012DAA1BE
MMEQTKHTTQNSQENYSEETFLPNSDRENLNIVFIDTTVPDYHSLISGVKPGNQIVILDPTKDGIAQITETLQNGKYQSVHIVSHGAEGSLQLGATQFNSDALDFYKEQLQQWANALTDGADILLYGCNVGSGEKGEAFVQQLSQLMGADVAASDDLTGSAAHGGDWNLEVVTGFIEAPLAFQVGVMEAYSQVLGIIEVTNTNDSGSGSLRQAILDANATPGDDTIHFTGTLFTDTNPDTITLTSGELNVTEAVTIVGTGANSLTISGNNSSRIFSATAPLTIINLKITGGNAATGDGGAIYSDSSVTIDNSTISGNSADGEGGGVWSSSSVTIANSTISSNSASLGGGIYSANNVAIANSTISGNTAKDSAGGVFASNGTIANSTITQNTADSDNDNVGDGGGVYNNGGTISVTNSIIAGNSEGDGTSDVAGSTFNGNANNLIGSTSGIISGTLGTGSDIVASDPKLAPLADNGGTTETHALLIGSPAINAGSNTQSNPNFPTIDQRGSTRTIGEIVDIGAVESDFVPPKVNFGAATYSITEDNNAIAVNISVTLDGTPATDVTVPIIINNNSTALADQDYIVSSNTVTFTAGATGTDLTQVLTITINSDDLPENEENIVFNFGTLKGAVAGTITETTLTIAANDPIVYRISTTNTTSVNEGNSGSQSITLIVTRSGGTGVESTVDYALSGTAEFGNDYNVVVEGGETASSGTISFAPGDTTKTITVELLGDDVYEANEDIRVTVSNPQPTTAPANSTIETNAAAVTIAIADDDPLPTVTINDVTVNESDTATLTVNLSNPSSESIIVSYSVTDGTAEIADEDYYVAPGESTITFAPGETSKTITVSTSDDNKFELDEIFQITLTPDSNANLVSKGEGVVTITNDDALPTVTIDDVTSNEGETATLTVSLSNPSSQSIDVSYSVTDGTATTADGDYTAPSESTITFAPGETSKTITVSTSTDNKFEPDETLKVTLATDSNANLGTKKEGVVTISNDDALPNINISDDVTINEGGTATFTLTLSNPSEQLITVNYTTSDGSATTTDDDYENLNVSTLTFAPGEISKTITVVTKHDNKFEENETFSIQLSDASNATLVKPQAFIAIANDDASPSIQIDDVS